MNETTNDQTPDELSPLDGLRGVGDLLRSDPARVARYAEALWHVAVAGLHEPVSTPADWDKEARAVVAVADEERAPLVAEVERLRGRLDISERSVAEARGDNPSGFWSQREWEDWSNELAMILPEDAECWPGVNPEGAQESIIANALRYLVAAEAKLAKVEALLHDGEGHLPSGLTVDLLGIAVDMEQEGRPLFAKWLRLMSAAALADAPAEQRAEGGA